MIDLGSELETIKKSLASAWARYQLLVLVGTAKGSLTVRPAVAGALSQETVGSFVAPLNVVSLKYGTVLVCVDDLHDEAFLLAQPNWRGKLRSPEERRTAGIDKVAFKGTVQEPVSGSPETYRLTVPALHNLNDVLRERDVRYIRQMMDGGRALLSSAASAPISERDGFQEFSDAGRAAIDAFTNDVARDANRDFLPEHELSSTDQATIRAERERQHQMGSMPSTPRTGRPSTSQLLPEDFGNLDLQS